MFCPMCGKQNVDHARFCQECGANFQSIFAKPDIQHSVASPAIQQMVALSSVVHYAGFWLRFAAYIIDYLVLFVPSFIIGFILGITVAASGGPRQIANMLGNILGFLIGWIYYATMESSQWQATVGKRAVGIKVTDLNGERIPFGKASGRFFGKIISGLILGIGFFMIGFTEKKQGLHDMMAGCLVVKKGGSLNSF